MPPITPQFVMEYERGMRTIRETSYMTLLADDNYWANRILRDSNIERKTDRVTWFLNTAQIEPIGPDGSGGMNFESLVTQSAEYPTFKHGAGTRAQIDELEDLDGTGLDQLNTWSADVGMQTAYYPQQLASQAILNGAATDGSANAYDGYPFFSDNATSGTPGNLGHPYNPYKLGLGGYWNWLHGAAVPASGSGATYVPAYPGGLPIDDSVDIDVALKNLGIAIAYALSLKQANGVQPRFLKVAYILAPPRMAPRLRQLTADTIPLPVSGGGAGSADVRAQVAGFGLGKPIIAAELGANFTQSAFMPFMGSGGNVNFKNITTVGSDTTYYLVMVENKTTQLGSLLHVKRKPFAVRYFGEGGQSVLDALLSRQDYIEYQCKGRMSVQYGHPYGIIRVDSATS